MIRPGIYSTSYLSVGTLVEIRADGTTWYIYEEGKRQQSRNPQSLFEECLQHGLMKRLDEDLMMDEGL